jgi:hypothetical protein
MTQPTRADFKIVSSYQIRFGDTPVDPVSMVLDLTTKRSTPT